MGFSEVCPGLGSGEGSQKVQQVTVWSRRSVAVGPGGPGSVWSAVCAAAACMVEGIVLS